MNRYEIRCTPKQTKKAIELGAPNDKRTIDFCAGMIKSRKTIFNEVNKAVTSFICTKPKEISEEKISTTTKLEINKNNDTLVSKYF